MTNTRLLFASTVSLCLSLSCATEVGPQGPTGPAGPTGSSPGSSPDCPDGYTRDTSQMNIIICRQGADEIVKIGKKGSAFWIDRYEASVWDSEDGAGRQYGVNMDDYPSSFPKNGQLTVALYALSKSGVVPSNYITWFQANEACRASGKRLPFGDEWLAAARGTLDPGDSAGNSGACVTNAAGLRKTGGGTKCVSDWGAQDMIGNSTELTNEWFAGLGKVSDTPPAVWPNTGTDYAGDVLLNISSGSASVSGGTGIQGLPSVALRGGDLGQRTQAGIFSINLQGSPSLSGFAGGFRCVIPR